MKKITNFLLGTGIVLSALSCKTIEEGVLIKTRIYAGMLEDARPMETGFLGPKKTFIQTDSMSFIVRGHPEVKSGTLCYVNRGRTYPVGGGSQSVWYFTWNSMDERDARKYIVSGRKRSF